MPRLFKSALAVNALLCASLLSSALIPKVVPTTAAAEGESNRKTTTAKPARGESAPAGAQTGDAEVGDLNSARLARTYGALPLTFEANRGQADPRVKFISHGAGYTLRLDSRGASLSLRARARAGMRAATLRLGFVGANPSAEAEGFEEVQAKSNYLIGRDASKWIVGVPNYARAGYRELYRGVDLVFYGNRGRLEYDFRVAPGADVSRVRLKFGGADGVRLGADGALVLRTRAGEVRQPRPAVYQLSGGEKRSVECDYTLNRSGEVGFRVGAYDRGEPLVIDPVFSYSTFFGGIGSDSANAIAVDSSGSAYIVGETDSSLPVSASAKQPFLAGSTDAFIERALARRG